MGGWWIVSECWCIYLRYVFFYLLLHIWSIFNCMRLCEWVWLLTSSSTFFFVMSWVNVSSSIFFVSCLSFGRVWWFLWRDFIGSRPFKTFISWKRCPSFSWFLWTTSNIWWCPSFSRFLRTTSNTWWCPSFSRFLRTTSNISILGRIFGTVGFGNILL